MKRCLVCQTESNDAALVCPACGEATWAKTVIVAMPEPVEVDAPVESRSVQRRQAVQRRAKVVEE